MQLRAEWFWEQKMEVKLESFQVIVFGGLCGTLASLETTMWWLFCVQEGLKLSKPGGIWCLKVKNHPNNPNFYIFSIIYIIFLIFVPKLCKCACQIRQTHTMFAVTLFTMGTGKFQAASYLTAMAKGCPLVKINLPITLDITKSRVDSQLQPSYHKRKQVLSILGNLLKQTA